MTAASTANANDKLDGAVLKVAGVVVLGAIMSILDITVVSVAIPTFIDVFHTTYANAAWTMTAYTLALATVIPLTGWAADRFGTKRLYMLALLLFVIGSALCSTAWNLQILIIFRILQGLGGGMLMPLGMTILTHAAGPDRVGRVMAVLGIPMLLGPIGGPILGGWLIQVASWHWIFLINVPIGVIALVYSQLVLPPDTPSPSESFDFVGMLLLSPGLALLLFGVSSVPAAGTIAATRVLLPGIIGIVLTIVFVFHAYRPEHPLIDLRLFKDRQLTISVIAMFFFAVAFFGSLFLIPSYFLQVRGETTLKAGILMAPQGIGAMLTMPVAGLLADKIGVFKIVVPGLAVATTGLAMMTQVGVDTSYTFILTALFIMGLGMGATMMPMMTAALQTLEGPTIARGSTLVNIMQQIAGSVGVAILSVVLTNQITKSTSVPPYSEAGGALQKLTKSLTPNTPPNPDIAAQIQHFTQQLAQYRPQALIDTAHGFAIAFVVGLVLLLVTFVPGLLLPWNKSTAAPDETDSADVAAVLTTL